MTTTVVTKYRGTKEYLLVYSKLLTAARYKGTVTYQEVAQIMGLPTSGNFMGTEVGHLLGQIPEDEHRNGRPILSAIAIGVSGMPGSGFFELARSLGKLAGTRPEDERLFLEREKATVYSTLQSSR